jgi:hypothetical protein
VTIGFIPTDAAPWPRHHADGYLWSWAPNGNRLWRKNRGVNAGTTCIGAGQGSPSCP